MREFYLVDDVGTTFYFDYRMKTLITNVTGLGINRSNTYLKYDNTYKLAKKEDAKSSINATLIFLDGYNGYTLFLNFLKKSSGELRLFYKLDTTKYAYVEVVSLSKTELNYGVLQCSLVLDKLSMWLKKMNYIINVNEHNNKKVFPFAYPFIYSASFNGEINVQNSGCAKAPVRLEINGKVRNPVVEIIKEDVIVQKLRLIVECSYETDIIIVDAKSTDQQITKITQNEIVDIYAFQDFTCENFLYLDIGTYKVRFDSGVAEKSTCKFQYLEMYEGH